MLFSGQLNSTVTESTGTSPYKILFGFPPNVSPQMDTEGDPVIPLTLEDDEVGYEDMEDVRISDSDSHDDDGNDEDDVGAAQQGECYACLTQHLS